MEFGYLKSIHISTHHETLNHIFHSINILFTLMITHPELFLACFVFFAV